MALLDMVQIMMEPYVTKEAYEMYTKFTQLYGNFVSLPAFEIPVLPTLLADMQVFTWFTAIYAVFYLPVIFLFVFLFFHVMLKRRNNRIVEDKSFFLFQTNKLNSAVVSKIKDTVGEYLSPWWYNPHLGTIFAFGGDCNLKYHREIIV